MVNYLLKINHAERIARTIYNAPTSLLTFPTRKGRGRKEGTRELVLVPLPYVVVYQVSECRRNSGV